MQLLSYSVELFHYSTFGDNEIGIVKGTKVSHGFNSISHRIGPLVPFTFLFNFYYLLEKL